ncbi:MAG: rhomboid family intramembrane serine protease [Campylobacter sp.]|nr:rhomboid family intramembrane serine protease [Campylobacter sp.]
MSFYKNNPVTLTIIVLNFAVFAVSYLIGKSSVDAFLGLNYLFFGGAYWQVFSSMFVHANFLHILMNMAVFYQFGTIIENFLGRLEFGLLYLVGGVLTSLICLFYIFYQANGGYFINMVGASGAICVLFGFFASLCPKEGKAMIISIVILSFLPGVAWYAHIVGLIIGFLYALIKHKRLAR